MPGDSTLSTEKLYEEANELLLNDEYENAHRLFSDAIKRSDKSDRNVIYNSYIGRSQTNLKLKKFDEALKDAVAAMDLNKTDSRAFLKKGIALFNLKEYSKSLEALEEGQKTAEAESEGKRNLFNEWINKCKKELPTPVPAQQAAKTSELKNDSDDDVIDREALIQVKPTGPPPIKHEWYQTESQVTVSVLSKNVTPADLTIETKDNILSIKSNDEEKLKINFYFNLEHNILPEQTQIKYLANKIEIKLKKSEPIQWTKLEIDPKLLSDRLDKNKILLEKKPEYPSSSRKPKNWDKIAADITAEEKDEKLEGDAALNKLFKDVYANGTDETRKAMNKSFLESGGTVLSTNWKDIAPQKVEVKAPDGMEWKKWD